MRSTLHRARALLCRAALAMAAVLPLAGPAAAQHAGLRTLTVAGEPPMGNPPGFDRTAFLPELESQVVEFFAEQWR